jgi:subtilase family serine protease
MQLSLLFGFIINYVSGKIFTEVPVYVALKQHNIAILQNRLLNISNPLSINYGQWMKYEEINKFIHPTPQHQQKVLDWISNYDTTEIYNYGDSIKFLAKPTIIMDMFGLSNKKSYHLIGYSIPMHLRHIIEFVEMHSNSINKTVKRNYKSVDNKTDDRYFGREPLLNLYNVPVSYNLEHNVSGGLIEYQSIGGFTNADLTIQQVANEQDINKDLIIVGNNEGTDDESELDVQLMSQAADGIQLWFWESPYWLYSLAVDFYNSENSPNVISMSWGWSEDSQCDIIDCTNITSKQYVQRVNNEYLKIALTGTTIVTASGDAGAPGRTNQQCDSSRPINPVFPGSSPYVTSVGATYVNLDNTTINYTTPLCLKKGCITSSDEKSIRYDSVGWTAGGGFDIYHNETPIWQKKAVTKYLHSGVILPNKAHFNRNGRAYPDISAIGHSCPTYLGGSLQALDGTSCSSPVIAGLLAIINNFLWTHHKIKLGFANPLLYHIQEYCTNCFQDITDGYNWCTEGGCCENTTDYGFRAIKGYDPVSGLGTPNIGNIVNFIKGMFVEHNKQLA